MITVFQLQRELTKVIEAGRGDVEICVEGQAITGMFYREGEYQAFEAAKATLVVLETGGSK